MILKKREIILISSLSFFIILSISGFQPNIFLGWYDELASTLSWARTTAFGELYNSKFSGGTILSEGVYRTPFILFFAIKQNHLLRQFILLFIQFSWITIFLIQIYKNWENSKYKNLALTVCALLLISDYVNWGYFYGGFGIKYLIVIGILAINNENFAIKKYKSLIFILGISLLGIISLTSIEYEAIFTLEVLLVCYLSKFSIKKRKLYFDQNLLISVIFCLSILIFIISTTPFNDQNIYIRDLIFNFREHSFFSIFYQENRNIWSSYLLRMVICVISLNLLNLRNSNKYLLICLIPTLTSLSIYFIQETIFFLGMDSKLLIYRSNYHLVDNLMLGIAYIGLIPNKNYSSKNDEFNLNFNLRFLLKAIILFSFFLPIYNSLLTRSRRENKWIKESRPLIKNALKNNECKYFAIRTDTLGKLFLYYDMDLKSFFGFKPYNSERKYTFVKGLLNENFDYPYQHLHMFGNLKDYKLEWLSLTGVCGLIDNKYNTYKISSSEHNPVLEKNIITSKSPKNTLNLMKKFKNKILNYEKVIVEVNKQKSINISNLKVKKNEIVISEFFEPTTKANLFSHEYSVSLLGICENERGEKNLGKVYSANLINTLVICKSIPKKVTLIIYER